MNTANSCWYAKSRTHYQNLTCWLLKNWRALCWTYACLLSTRDKLHWLFYSKFYPMQHVARPQQRLPTCISCIRGLWEIDYLRKLTSRCLLVNDPTQTVDKHIISFRILLLVKRWTRCCLSRSWQQYETVLDPLSHIQEPSPKLQ